MITPKFVTIVAASSVIPNAGAYVYGLTAEGVVYAWNGPDVGWVALKQLAAPAEPPAPWPPPKKPRPPRPARDRR